MNNMKIKTKLIIGFFIPIVLTIVNVLLAVSINNNAVDTLKRLNEEASEKT